MPVSRRLVAVVVADVVGYSRLMERDEAGTHQRLRALNAELIAPKIAEHGGRMVKTTGDGMLVEFGSATAALRCAVEIQREMESRNREVPADDRIAFRIGINLGDIIVEGDDIIGDGVNVAARLETLAEPGGICVAAAVWEQVHEDLGIEFVDSGEQHVKNISKPVRVFRVGFAKSAAGRAPPRGASVAVAAARETTAPRAAIAVGALALLLAVGIGTWQWMQRPTLPITAAAGPSPQSILVLPFTGPGGDAALDSLAGMLSGDVARLLANSLRDATIVAGAAAKDKSADERTLAKEANVRYVVAGDVRLVGEDIAVTARLIDGTTAKQLASERRTIARARATEDQDLLVRRITAAARLMFQNAEGRRLAAEPLVATDARSLVARADAIFTEEDLASTRAARQLYEQARERDPSLMGAWIGHMYTLVSELWNDFAGGRDPRLLAEIDRDSRRAVELDARDPQAWFARADALQNQWQWQAESEAYDRAAALDPSRFNSRAGLYILSGRSAEALRQIEKRNALEGGPDSATLFGACHAYIHLGRYEEALSQCERAVASDNFYWLYLDLIAAYAETGDMARAAAAKDQLLKRVPDFTISRLLAKQFSNNPVWSEEIRTRFVPGWRKAGLPE